MPAPLVVYGQGRAHPWAYPDDVVGRFRSGYQLNGTPAALTEWRITTGDPEVAAAVYDLLGGDAPQEWPAKGEDNLEVFTATGEVEILLAGPKAVRQRLVLREHRPTGRRRAAPSFVPVPEVQIDFKLVGAEALGSFSFRSASWTLLEELRSQSTPERLAAARAGLCARLGLETVSYTPAVGPRAGRPVLHTTPRLVLAEPGRRQSASIARSSLSSLPSSSPS